MQRETRFIVTTSRLIRLSRLGIIVEVVGDMGGGQVGMVLGRLRHGLDTLMIVKNEMIK